MDQTMAERIRDDIHSLRLSLDTRGTKLEDRCEFLENKHSGYDRAVTEAVARLNAIEKIVTTFQETLRNIEKVVASNADAVKHLTENTLILQGIVNNLISTCNDREKRIRDLERYRWHIGGAIIVAVAVVQWFVSKM